MRMRMPPRAEVEEVMGLRRKPFWARWKGSKGKKGKGREWEGGGKME